MSNLWNKPVSGSGYGASQYVEPSAALEQAPQDSGVPAGFQDYTGTTTRFEDTDIYRNAINVSESRPVDENFSVENPAPYQERVVRRVEVPFTRSVKVPVKTTKLVPDVVVQQVPVKKLVQVPSFTVVEEEYTVFEEREAVREKEVWVKQIVPETYMEKVPVKKVRQVQRPFMDTREVEEMVSVEVPTNRAVEVDGFRVDEVEDTKLVEVEEYQTYDWVRQPTDQRQLAVTREIGRVPGQHVTRNVGNVLDGADSSLADIDVDSCPDGAMPVDRAPVRVQSQQRAFPTDSYYRQMGQERDASAAQVAFANDNFTDGRFIRAAGGADKSAVPVQGSGQSLGLSVKNTHTRHTDGTGVLVTKVERGGAAARAGLHETDIITSVQNIPTAIVEDFAAVLKSVPGPLALTVNRDGRRNISITLIR